MRISRLRARATRLERKLEGTLGLMDRLNDVKATSADISQRRTYAFDADLPPERLTECCSDSLSKYGFTVIDRVIPSEIVESVRKELINARSIIRDNLVAIEELRSSENPSSEAARKVELRSVRRVGHPPKPPNDIIWMPEFARHLANPRVSSVASRVLDDHLRIAQLHLRIIEGDKPDGTPGGFGPVSRRARHVRGWHTDWPHDLSGYGGDDALHNAGCIRQPFPDVAMCLVMIWYLTDVDADSGGTWVVPGSHKDLRNPRGTSDGISAADPIPGEIQISAPAGSVYIQDSRAWHASARHNPGHDRVAVVTRWCPWWVAVDDFAPGETYNTNIVCRPLSHSEFHALPRELKPLMRHLCPDELDTLQQPVLDRAAAAAETSSNSFRQQDENPDSSMKANAHIRVRLGHSADRD